MGMKFRQGPEDSTKMFKYNYWEKYESELAVGRWKD